MTQIYVTKLVLETQSPMAINTGKSETDFDAQLARDANGFPYIPATSIAGVWSHLAVTMLGESFRDKWFGTTEQASSLVISNGVLHDQNNVPVSSQLLPAVIENDELLSLLIQERPHHRERVAINDRGVARTNEKFDQLLLPKGVRYSVTLKWTTQQREDEDTLCNEQWQQLLALLNDRKFAMGSSTRNGLGKIKVIACEQNCFDLTKGPTAGRNLQQCLNDHKVKPGKLPELKKHQLLSLASLPLKAMDTWRCGSGTALLGTNEPQGKVSMISYSEPQIIWHNNSASVAPDKAVLCGSSVKGILAHRIAFHLRRFCLCWAEDMADADHQQWQQLPQAVKAQYVALFGFAAESDDSGQAGLLFVEDSDITFQHTVLRTHNRIDRFTGGVQQGALFTEELLFKPEFTVNIWIDKSAVLAPEMVQALNSTFNELKTGMLPLGAGNNSLVAAQNNKDWQCDTDLIQQSSTAQELAS